MLHRSFKCNKHLISLKHLAFCSEKVDLWEKFKGKAAGLKHVLQTWSRRKQRRRMRLLNTMLPVIILLQVEAIRLEKQTGTTETTTNERM